MQDKSNRARGGIARAESLTPEERIQIAQKAASARWNPELSGLPRASHVGTLKIGDAVVECAVLEDKTRVLTRATFVKAIGRTGKVKGGREYDSDLKIPVFLSAKNLAPYIPSELGDTAVPVLFNLNGQQSIGYKAEFLPLVCGVFIDAEKSGHLKPNQIHIAEKCKILIRALATVGIVALIDEATGYQEIRPQDALQKYLEMIVRKELAAWAKKFPDEFYENIYKLKGWTWPGMKKNRFSVVAHYTRDLVYERIAPGLLQELEKKSPKDEAGHRKNKLHQWLTEDIGDPMLAQHIHSLIMFQRLALANGHGWHRFVKMVDKVLPKRGVDRELPFDDFEESSSAG